MPGKQSTVETATLLGLRLTTLALPLNQRTHHQCGSPQATAASPWARSTRWLIRTLLFLGQAPLPGESPRRHGLLHDRRRAWFRRYLSRCGSRHPRSTDARGRVVAVHQEGFQVLPDQLVEGLVHGGIDARFLKCHPELGSPQPRLGRVGSASQRRLGEHD